MSPFYRHFAGQNRTKPSASPEAPVLAHRGFSFGTAQSAASFFSITSPVAVKIVANITSYQAGGTSNYPTRNFREVLSFYPKIVFKYGSFIRCVEGIVAQTRAEALQGVADQLDALQGAINGLSRVAEVIAAVPANERSKALTAAEASYRQSALDLGYNDVEAHDWLAAIIFRLRNEVHARSQEETAAGSVNLTSLSAA
jgi:hypothetical protein